MNSEATGLNQNASQHGTQGGWSQESCYVLLAPSNQGTQGSVCGLLLAAPQYVLSESRVIQMSDEQEMIRVGKESRNPADKKIVSPFILLNARDKSAM